MKESGASSATNWNQIYSLVGLNAAIVISWIAYHNYQPKVLELFNFQALSLFLAIAQALILVFIPPIAGIIGDRVIRSGGNRFVVFTVGISVTAMVFMCVAFTVGTASSINLTAAFPFMIVVWLISMNIFHSPANSMLEMFASVKALPAAMALLVLTTDLLYACEPLIVNLVDWLGPVFTFATGGVLLIVTGYFFRKTTRNFQLNRSYEESKQSNSNLGTVMVIGLIFGCAVAFIKNYLPEKIDSLDDTLSGPAVVSLVLGLSALLAWPLSRYVDSIGTRKSLQYGFAGMIICFLAIASLSNMYVLLCFALLAAPCFSLASVAAFPFALQQLSVRNVTLGTGIFFGCAEVADGVMNVLSSMQ